MKSWEKERAGERRGEEGEEGRGGERREGGEGIGERGEGKGMEYGYKGVHLRGC